MLPYTISVSTGRDASEIVVDAAEVWATHPYSYLHPLVLLVLDLSLPYESFLLGPADLRICMMSSCGHILTYDKLAPFLPVPSMCWELFFQGILFSEDVMAPFWNSRGLHCDYHTGLLWTPHSNFSHHYYLWFYRVLWPCGPGSSAACTVV